MIKNKHPNIPMNAVKSGSVATLGHAGTTLAVRYKSGGSIYHYTGVTQKQYDEVMKAKSIGTAMGGIKAKHKFTKVK